MLLRVTGSADDQGMASTPDLEANLDHLRRLARHRQRLTEALADTVEATAASAARADMTPREVHDLMQELRELGVEHRGKISRAAGFSSSALRELAARGWRHHPAPGVPCVYLLLEGAEVVYIGMTIGFTSRLASHNARRRRGEISFDNYEVIECVSENAAADLEAVLQQQHRPRFNKRIEQRKVS